MVLYITKKFSFLSFIHILYNCFWMTESLFFFLNILNKNKLEAFFFQAWASYENLELSDEKELILHNLYSMLFHFPINQLFLVYQQILSIQSDQSNESFGKLAFLIFKNRNSYVKLIKNQSRMFFLFFMHIKQIEQKTYIWI